MTRPPHWDPDPLHTPELVPVRRDRESNPLGVFAWMAGCLVVIAGVGIVALLAIGFAAPRSAPSSSTSPTDSAQIGAPLERESLGRSSSRHDGGATLEGGIGSVLIAGTATWYCGAGSPCTDGYGPDDYVAAIDSDLGFEKGDQVRVTYGEHVISVVIVDVCACAGERLVDLTTQAFVRLVTNDSHPSEADRQHALGLGVIPVTIELGGGGPRVTLPPTDVEP